MVARQQKSRQPNWVSGLIWLRGQHTGETCFGALSCRRSTPFLDRAGHFSSRLSRSADPGNKPELRNVETRVDPKVHKPNFAAAAADRPGHAGDGFPDQVGGILRHDEPQDLAAQERDRDRVRLVGSAAANGP